MVEVVEIRKNCKPPNDLARPTYEQKKKVSLGSAHLLTENGLSFKSP
jgi:hypothetical protein